MKTVICCDTREKTAKKTHIFDAFDRSGIEYIRTKLYVGDYALLNDQSLCIDVKQGLSEVYSNLVQDHERFRRELIRARDAWIKLIVLVEHGEGINSLEDVIFWENPRREKSPKAINGDRLYKILQTVERKYGCTFAFCDKRHTGEEIIRWLTMDG